VLAHELDGAVARIDVDAGVAIRRAPARAARVVSHGPS
jgi:hypothetical protein